MILVDTSAWVDFLRGTGSHAHRLLERAVSEQQDLAGTEPVRMELLAGTRDAEGRHQVTRLMDSVRWLPVQPESDFDAAASTYQSCRRSGFTPRGLIDCLIAAIAMRNGAQILAADGDFERLATVMPLRLVR